MAHTPGPWRVEINTEEDADWARKWPTIVADEYEVVGTEGLYGDIETDIANARLIAAAPDLLEALKAYDQWADKTICTDQELKKIREQMRAAIAKATGEQ